MALRAYEYVSNQVPRIRREYRDSQDAYDAYLRDADQRYERYGFTNVEHERHLDYVHLYSRRMYGLRDKLQAYEDRAELLADMVRAAGFAELLRRDVPEALPPQIYDSYFGTIK